MREVLLQSDPVVEQKVNTESYLYVVRLYPVFEHIKGFMSVGM